MIVAALAMLGALAAACDLRWRRIPNWLTAGGFGLGLLLNYTAAGWPGLIESLKGAALAFAIHLPLFALRAMGGGDVKLMTAIGALAGPAQWLVIFAINAVLGGVLALLLAWRHGRLRQTLSNTGEILGSLSKAERPALDLDRAGAIMLPRGAVAAVAIALWVISRL